MGLVDGNMVTAPVGIGDVRAALGAATGDLGLLCTHANINKWAKYKPVRSSLPYMDPDAYRTQWIPEFGVSVDVPNYLGDVKFETGVGRVYEIEGRSVTFDLLNVAGLVVPMISNLSGQYGDGEFLELATAVIRHLAEHPELNWAYRPPRGGAEDPYRLTDFDGYRNDAECTFRYAISGEVYGDADDVGISFGGGDGAISFEKDLLQVLGYRGGVNALEWELGAIVTTEQGYDHKLVSSAVLTGGNDTVRIEYERILAEGFTPSAFYVYLCAVRNDRKRIYFFPEAEGGKPYGLMGFRSGINPDLDGGIGPVLWPSPQSCYYASDGTAPRYGQKWYRRYYDDIHIMEGGGWVCAVNAKPNSSFSVVGTLRNDDGLQSVLILVDHLSATAEFELDGGTKVRNVAVGLHFYSGEDGGNVEWAQDNGLAADPDNVPYDTPAFELGPGESVRCAVVFYGTYLDNSPVGTETCVGTLRLKYTYRGRMRTLAEYKFAVRNENGTAHMDGFYDTQSGTYLEPEYSLADM